MKHDSVQYKKSFFIFRRDLRLEDNTALRMAFEQSDTVITCFIVDPEQVGPKNKYKSSAALQFMISALDDLATRLRKKGGRLYVFHGRPAAILKKLIVQEKIDAVFVNRDYTPYSALRDAQLNNVCERLGVAFHAASGLLLHEPERVQKKAGGFYSVFTPFYRAASKLPVSPQKTVVHTCEKRAIAGAYSSPRDILTMKENKYIAVQGTRAAAVRILKSLDRYAHYAKERDIPALDATTHLSAYIKFGVVSLPEVYAAVVSSLGKQHPLIRQLYWHDFFTHIVYHAPRVLGAPFRERYEHVRWRSNKKMFDLWCAGRTGFPIVDAGMRELVATGYMHNRVRMITASFLIKDLHIDWREGERFFATQLVDYDPAVNNGNWQWVASTGCDAQPYFRIFNPWHQQKRFDADCVYIKRWVPELVDVPCKDIHAWYKAHENYKGVYEQPLVDHERERKVALAMFGRR